MDSSENLLQPDEQQYLLQLARTVIKESANGEENYPGDYYSENLRQQFGVFVTLHKKGELRGCIGYIEGFKPLQDAVIEMAKSAAFNDPRFPSVTFDEVDDLEIEISVLSPIRSIENVDMIEVGKHGLIIEQGFYKGLLLPQVATEYNWDRNTFLSHTCRKAGLNSNAWKEKKTIISIFSAEIFSENDFKDKIS